MPELPLPVIRLIELAIEEDLGSGDITSDAVFTDDPYGRAVIEAREPTVCCGLEVAREVYRRIDHRIKFMEKAGEGAEVQGGALIAALEGPVRGLLAGERTALNFLQRACGIAAQSRRFARIADGRTVILDSRKTVPGWRWLDKMAVRTGGCSNHRMGLYDGILIKDNHIAACGSIAGAVEKARKNAPPKMDVEVEVDDTDGLEQALASGADVIMLDNFPPGEVARAVEICAGRARLELSGGIDENNIQKYLEMVSVDYISIGALTHSVRAADIAMEIWDD